MPALRTGLPCMVTGLAEERRARARRRRGGFLGGGSDLELFCAARALIREWIVTASSPTLRDRVLEQPHLASRMVGFEPLLDAGTGSAAHLKASPVVILGPLHACRSAVHRAAASRATTVRS